MRLCILVVHTGNSPTKIQYYVMLMALVSIGLNLALGSAYHGYQLLVLLGMNSQ